MSQTSVNPAVPSSTSMRWLCATDTPLSFQMDAAARTLAGDINAGAYNELDEDGRIQLRALSLRIAAWSERVDAIETERLPQHRQPRRPMLLARIIRLLRRH